MRQTVLPKLARAAGPPAVPLVLLAAWAIAAGRAGDAFLLPGPADVWRALLELARSGRLAGGLLLSLARVCAGFLLAAACGVPLGILAGRSAWFTRASRGTLDFFRQVPAVALVPLFILWFGLGEASKLVVIFYASFFPVFLAAELGAEQADPLLVEAGRLYLRKPGAVLRRVILPSALPALMTGLRLGVGYGWRSLVVAEMLAAARGLGALIVEARGFGRTDAMLAGVLCIGAAGILLDRALSAAERAVPWARRQEASRG